MWEIRKIRQYYMKYFNSIALEYTSIGIEDKTIRQECVKQYRRRERMQTLKKHLYYITLDLLILYLILYTFIPSLKIVSSESTMCIIWFGAFILFLVWWLLIYPFLILLLCKTWDNYLFWYTFLTSDMLKAESKWMAPSDKLIKDSVKMRKHLTTIEKEVRPKRKKSSARKKAQLQWEFTYRNNEFSDEKYVQFKEAISKDPMDLWCGEWLLLQHFLESGMTGNDIVAFGGFTKDEIYKAQNGSIRLSNSTEVSEPI